MKIAFVIGGFAFGGAERVLCAIANRFYSDGNEVSIITLANAEKTYPLADNIKIINGIGWKNYFDGVLKLRRVLVNENADIIISFLVQVNIAVCMAMLGKKTPVIISERNDPKRMPSEKYKKILRKIFYRFSDGYVFQTEEAKQYFSKAIQKRSVVIPNPIFLEESMPTTFDEKNHNIVSVGRYVPQKNQKMLISAFTKACRLVDSDWKLEFYGEGDLKPELAEQIESLGMNDRIKLCNPIRNIPEMLGTKAVFVLPSNYEGMPNALIEAMGMGLACISTDCPCGGPRYLIESGDNGLLVSVDNEDEMVDALCSLMSNHVMRKRLGRNASDIRQKLNIEVVYDMWKKYVAEVIKKGK